MRVSMESWIASDHSCCMRVTLCVFCSGNGHAFGVQRGFLRFSGWGPPVPCQDGCGHMVHFHTCPSPGTCPANYFLAPRQSAVVVWFAPRPENAGLQPGAWRPDACVLLARPLLACVTFGTRPLRQLENTNCSGNGRCRGRCACTLLACTLGRVPCPPLVPNSGGCRVSVASGTQRAYRVLVERSVPPPTMYPLTGAWGHFHKCSM